MFICLAIKMSEASRYSVSTKTAACTFEHQFCFPADMHTFLFERCVPLVDVGAYLGVNLILTTLSILLAVILVQLHDCKTEVPSWLRKVSKLVAT